MTQSMLWVQFEATPDWFAESSKVEKLLTEQGLVVADTGIGFGLRDIGCEVQQGRVFDQDECTRLAHEIGALLGQPVTEDGALNVRFQTA